MVSIVVTVVSVSFVSFQGSFYIVNSEETVLDWPNMRAKIFWSKLVLMSVRRRWYPFNEAIPQPPWHSPACWFGVIFLDHLCSMTFLFKKSCDEVVMIAIKTGISWHSFDFTPKGLKEGKFIWGGHPSPTGKNKKTAGQFLRLDFLYIPRLRQRFLQKVNSFAPEVC